MERYDWTIKDVAEATGLDYCYIRKALQSGELDGLVAPRLLRTNATDVENWLALLRVDPPSKPSPATAAPVTWLHQHTRIHRHLEVLSYPNRKRRVDCTSEGLGQRNAIRHPRFQLAQVVP